MAKARRSRVRYVSRRVRRFGRRNKFNFPVAVIAGLIPAAAELNSAYKSGGFGGVAQWTSILTTGYDPADGQMKFSLALKKFYGPLVAGILVHKFVGGRLGVNQALARAGVPFIRL